MWTDPLMMGSMQQKDSVLPDWSFGTWECPPSPFIELGSKKGQVVKIERPKRPPRSILNAKRGLTLVMADAAGLPVKWPWSHHWAICDDGWTKHMMVRIRVVDLWMDKVESAGGDTCFEAKLKAGLPYAECICWEVLMAWIQNTNAA